MTRKCNCRKCIHCKTFTSVTAIPRVRCKYFDNDYAPDCCDKYETLKEAIKKQKKKIKTAELGELKKWMRTKF